ncbi:unnamed protein product [Heligmosomoides polygyrus]|uniref:Protein kinase domain-containing protein n=1 Tax=Heligmosomoides polygyrus TaxID=6339 RepID=A0A3P8AQU8_HELPZ|nr:unnamed protein product [Heligmosomoides polygyrus]
MLKTATAVPNGITAPSNGVSNSSSKTDLVDEDPETLSMRLTLLESLQSKIMGKEREDGEVVSDEGSSGSGKATNNASKSSVSSKSKKITTEGSQNENHERSRDRTTTTTTSSKISSSRSKRPLREATQSKSDTSSSKHISELSVTLPAPSAGTNTSDVVVTALNEKRKRSSSERQVDGVSSHSVSENRHFKKVVNTGDHISVTVDTRSGGELKSPSVTVSEGVRMVTNNAAHVVTSTPKNMSINSRITPRSFSTDFANAVPHIPLPPTPLPSRPQHTSPTNSKEFSLLPPPPAPPVFPNLVENCNPSSIRIQVSEGGGRVAQLSKPPKSSDTTTSTSKPKPPPPCAPCKSPSFTNLTDKGDNYEDVGMDVESSSCESEPEHKDDTGRTSPRNRVLSDADDMKLREMLLQQVTRNRQKNAESAGQSSSSSVHEGRDDNGAAPANSYESCEETRNADVKDVLPQGNGEPNRREVQQQETPRSVQVAETSLVFLLLTRYTQMDESFESTGQDTPLPSSLSQIDLMLRGKQSELGELESDLSMRMSDIDESMLRRAALRQQLAELEANIQTERARCLVLLRRRNEIRREVERCEEKRLELLFVCDCGVECDSREVEQQQKRNEEQEMRTKLLARMRKGGDTLVNSGGDVNKLDNSAVSSIETTSSEQSTQTLMHGEEDGAQESEPLYRSHRFPQRLKRYVGLAPDFDAECENECPNEMKGKKCTDVSCESYVSYEFL